MKPLREINRAIDRDIIEQFRFGEPKPVRHWTTGAAQANLRAIEDKARTRAALATPREFTEIERERFRVFLMCAGSGDGRSVVVASKLFVP